MAAFRKNASSNHNQQPATQSEMSHERYFELCALAPTGTLSDREWTDLRAHLSQCSKCSQLLPQYRELARTGMPLLISDRTLDDHKMEQAWTPQLARNDFFRRLARGDESGWTEEQDPVIRPLAVDVTRFWSRLRITSCEVGLRYAAILLIVGAASAGIYRLGTNNPRHPAQTTDLTRPEDASKLLQAQINLLTKEKTALDQQVKERDQQITALSKQWEPASRELATLKKAEQTTDSEFRAQTIVLDEVRTEKASAIAQLSTMAHKLEGAEATVASLQTTLDRLKAERNADFLRTAALEERITELSLRFKKQDERGKQDEEFLASDRDIRDLMGARDLYIADVFDVDPNGRTEKPFGRVFYTRGKSLIFYAFDLDKQRGLRDANTFQAWGRRDHNDQHPVNMGIFYMDNQTNRRWVLKFDDPEVLARIDTIFVTVEPQGGSEHPKGKALLVASLRSQPNHP